MVLKISIFGGLPVSYLEQNNSPHSIVVDIQISKWNEVRVICFKPPSISLTISQLLQVYFGASDMVLNTYDSIYPTEADAEILGCGTLICFMIVTPMILLAYAVEGRKNIQATSLDAIFSFVGAAMLIAVGGNHLITKISTIS